MSISYSHDYKEEVFWLWYNKGQPTPGKLALIVPACDGLIPTEATLRKWLDDWSERTAELDQEVKDKFSAEVIQSKVEMLRRHAKMGKDIQEIGLAWIEAHKDELTPSVVVRLIKDGYEIEKASVGVPEALTKMLSTSDEDLKKQIEAALTGEDLDLFDAS